MDAKARNRMLWAGLPLVLLLAGCGNYTITFEVADVINAWGGDITREELFVDILCLSKDDVKNHPEIVNGTMRADEWFKARDEVDHRIGDISPKRIYALRRGGPGDSRDTLLGPSLLSFVDRADGRRTTSVKVHHPNYLSSEAAIVIYGRFSSPTGVAQVPPLVIQPPGSKDQITIDVGRKGMTLAGRR
jgi:hypothetical protein